MQEIFPIKKRAANFHGNGNSGRNKTKGIYNNPYSRISQIQSRYDCSDILNMFDIHAKPGINICCPIHEDTNPSFSIYDDGKKFKCHGCESGGDCIDLFMFLSGMDKVAAIRYLTALDGRSDKLRVSFSDRKATTRRALPTPPVLNLKTNFQKFIDDCDDMSYDELLAEFLKKSSFKPDSIMDYNPVAEAVAFVEALYAPEEYVFTGDKFDAKKRQQVMLCDTLISDLKTNGVRHPFVCLNPVNPDGALNDNGLLSFRTKRNIAKHKYSLFENDTADLRDQAAFWYKMILKGFPVRAIVFSGNKSLHSIVETQLGEIDDLKVVFTKLGFDGKTFDPARQSRLPGYWREDTQKYQQLI